MTHEEIQAEIDRVDLEIDNMIENPLLDGADHMIFLPPLFRERRRLEARQNQHTNPIAPWSIGKRKKGVL